MRGVECPPCGAAMEEQIQSIWFSRPVGAFDFLREKNFIRPLTPEQIAELRRNIQIVNCSNCGAPIDLARGAACGHCARWLKT
jgi:hypothetical protein